MSVFIFIIIIVGLVTFGEVASKWLEAGGRPPQLEPGREEEEMARLREQVALLADQVDRLSEEQRFMTRLLESGPPVGRPSSGESRPGSMPGPSNEEPS